MVGCPGYADLCVQIMLREIPQATEQSVIRALFGQHEDKIVNLRPEIGDNWYVNFEDEDLAMAALEHLQFGGVTFQGQSVRARIKSENLVCRAVSPIHPASSIQIWLGRGG